MQLTACVIRHQACCKIIDKTSRLVPLSSAISTDTLERGLSETREDVTAFFTSKRDGKTADEDLEPDGEELDDDDSEEAAEIGLMGDFQSKGRAEASDRGDNGDVFNAEEGEEEEEAAAADTEAEGE